MALNIEVREHRTDELRTLVALTARSFWDDPLYNFFTPDLLSQHKTTGLFHSLLLDAAAHGSVWTAQIGDECVGVAAWLPPGVKIPDRGLRAMKQLFRIAPSVLRSKQRRTALALFSELPKHHMEEDHWYLSLLATDPKFQGRGVGTALLLPILAEADNSGSPVFLETQNEHNLSYYARFGFRERSVIEVQGCPPVWTMNRSPSVEKSFS